MFSVYDDEFKTYGRVLELDVSDFMDEVKELHYAQAGTVCYEASIDNFEKTGLFEELRDRVFGGMPIEFGCCWGYNSKLNGLEYHRGSEVNIAAEDMVVMLGHRWDIDYSDNSYDTDLVKAFFVPKGTAIELFGTTLHYAPCGIDGKEFRSGVVLDRGTNLPLKNPPPAYGVAAMLFATNKWLMVHPESGESGRVGKLKGKNRTITEF